MSNPVFGKTMKNVRKNKDAKLVATEKRRNYLVSKPNFHSTKFFTENQLEIEMRKTQYLQINQSTQVYQYYHKVKQ